MDVQYDWVLKLDGNFVYSNFQLLELVQNSHLPYCYLIPYSEIN